MASYSPKLLDQNYKSWIKAQLAVRFTKEGIESFVCRELQEFQLKCLSDICYNNGLISGTSCSSCCTENVVKCPTKRICNVRLGRCNYHRNSATQYNPAGCPNKICHNFVTEIQNAHRYYCPSYKNTDATQWCSNAWEVAKCFISQDGYKDVDYAQETDFNAIISVIINNKDFQGKVHENVSNKTNIFEQARRIGRVVRHSPTLEVDNNDLQQFFKVFQQLLSDTGYLATDKNAQNAKQKLLHLENEAIVIANDVVKEILYDAAKVDADNISNEILDQTKNQNKMSRAEIIQRKLDEVLKAAEVLLQTIKEQNKLAVNLAETMGRKLSTEIKEDKEKHYFFDRLKLSIESTQSFNEGKEEDYRKLMEGKEQGLKVTINMAANLAETTEEKLFTEIKEDKEKRYFYDKQKPSIERTQSFNIGKEEYYRKSMQGNVNCNKNALQAACQRYGKHSQEVKILTEKICHDIKTRSKNITKVWPAYRENDKNDVVFVVVSNKHADSSKEINYNQDFEIVMRQEMETNDENMLVLKHEFKTDSYIDDSKNRAIKDVIKKHVNTLRKQHSNLTMICASSVKSSGFLSGKHSMENEDCIVLYVHIKGYIPLQEDCFPKMLDGFQIDVRENVFQTYGSKKPSDFCENLKMGCEIGQNQIEGYGTIGGFIEHESHGLCLMTCSHIFLDPEGLRKKNTPLITCNQPSYKKGIGKIESKRCGELKFHKVGTVSGGRACVDVAFVKIDTRREPVDGTFPSISYEDLMNSGFDKDYIPQYTSGKVYNTDEIIKHKRNRFIKYGATTLLRQGRYHSDSAFVILFGQADLTLENQIQMIDMDLEFAAEGDSGALVFCVSDEELVAAGLLVGGWKGSAIMTPICDILHAVGYSPPYALKKFPDANDYINCHIQTKRSEGEPRNVVRKRLKQAQAHMDEVVDNMPVNVDKVLERDQQISDLDNRADALQAGSSQFEASDGKLKRKFWWKNCKMRQILIGIIVVIFVIIIVWVVNSQNGGSDSKEASTDTITSKSTR